MELESRKCGKYLFNPSTGETKRASKDSQTALLKPKEVCIYYTDAMIVLLPCSQYRILRQYHVLNQGEGKGKNRRRKKRERSQVLNHPR